MNGDTTPSGLKVRDLTVTYETESGPLHTVRNLSMSIAPGEIYGLVGESGSGKTTLALALVRYLPDNGRIDRGSVELDGVDLQALSKNEMRRTWGSKITMVHQDPNKSVNPSMMIGAQIAEIARTHLGMSKAQARDKAVEMANRAANVLEAENRIRQEIREQGSTLAKVVNLQRWEQKGMTPDVG